MAYATNTKVSVEKSRAEIESILIRYGATAFCYAMRNQPDDAKAQIQFECNGKVVQFNLKLPSREEFRYTEARGTERHEEDISKHWEQGCRSRWRSLCLCIKAKLEAVEAEITTFEHEFLAHIVIPGAGKTLGNEMIPRIETAYETNEVPLLTFDG